MRQTIISSSKDLALARLSPDTRFSLLPRMGGPPYLQAVGAWLRRRRRLVRLEEDLLAPPEELDNSDEDVVQHQDHARRRPPAPPARPARCARSARPQPLRRSARGSAPVPPRLRLRPAPGLQAPPTSLPPGTAPQRLPKIGPPPDPGRLAPARPSPSQDCFSGSATGIPSPRSPLQPLLPSACPIAAPPIWQSTSQSPVHCRTSFSPHHLDFSSPARAQKPSPEQWRDRAAVQSRNPEVPSLLPVEKEEVEGEI